MCTIPRLLIVFFGQTKSTRELPIFRAVLPSSINNNEPLALVVLRRIISCHKVHDVVVVVVVVVFVLVVFVIH